MISAIALAVTALAIGTSADATVNISIEAAGATSTTLTGYQFGVANLDSAPNGLSTVSFAGTPVTGATTSGFINIYQANVYGGAGGTGSFGSVTGAATISLSNAVNYFGIWGSALDGQNTVALYSGATLLGSYALQNILESSSGFSNAYYGNPAGTGNGGEEYAFFNFRSDIAFDSVRLIQNSGGGFEFDNLTVGQVSAAPEPATWAMLLIGFGAIGAMMRSKRRLSVFAAG